MKTAEDRIKFKNHFHKLGQGRIIPILQTRFWKVFWEEPDSAADIFDLISAEDIKTIRNQNEYNYLLFVRIICLKIVEINKEKRKLLGQLVKHLLNCVRFLTKLLPLLYELEDYFLEIEGNLFWKQTFQIKLTSRIIDNDKSDTVAYLGADLMTSLVDLLFTCEFTVVPPPPSQPYKKKSEQFWEAGMGSNLKQTPTNLIYESNRSDILRLIITLCSSSMYQSPAEIVLQGCKFSTFLVTSIPKLDILTLAYSLFNLVCRSAKTTDNGLELKNSQLLEMKYMYITHSIQLLTYMMVYPVPKDLQFLDEASINHRNHNLPKYYFSRYSKQGDLTNIVESLNTLIRQALVGAKSSEDNTFSMGRINSQPSLWATLATILLWELIQCNSTVKSLVTLNKISQLMISLVYNIFTFHNSPNHKALIKENSYFLLYLSSDNDMLENTFDLVNETYTSLPTNFKVSPSPITTRDFLVIQLCQLLITKISILNEMLGLTLVESLYNLIIISSSRPIHLKDVPVKRLQNANPNGGLSYAAVSSITQLITKFSHKQFLMEQSIHANLLAIVLRAVTTAAIKSPKSSRMLLFSILKNEKVYNQVWTNIYSFTSEYFEGNTFVSGIDESEVIAIEPNTLVYNGINSLARITSNKSLESTLSEKDNTKALSNNNSLASLVDQEATDLIIDEVESSMRPEPLTGMSERAIEKMPKGTPIRRAWGGTDSLRIILTVIVPYLKMGLDDKWSRQDASVETYELVVRIENLDYQKMMTDNKSQINYDFLPENSMALLKFSWSPLSKGWYLSLLFSDIYYSVDHYNAYSGINNRLMRNLSETVTSVSKFASSWTSFLQSSSANSGEASPQTIDWVGKSNSKCNEYAETTVKLFKLKTSNNDSFFNFNRLTTGGPGTPTMHSDRPPPLSRRVSDIRINNTHRGSVTSVISNHEEKEQLGRNSYRNSVTSLHSLNTLNRTRSNTPRNSISHETR